MHGATTKIMVLYILIFIFSDSQQTKDSEPMIGRILWFYSLSVSWCM